jgi:hypothetical protein
MNVPPHIIDNYTLNVLTNPPIRFNQIYNERWNIKWKSYHTGRYIDFFSIRQDAIAMADNADFIFIGDDDMKFKEGFSETINECCFYLKENPDCGAILLSGKFGDEYKYHGNEIYIINSGHVSINRGIMLRNRPNMMDNRLHAVGACDDWALNFTCLIQGYYLARKLNVPIDHDTQTRIGYMGAPGVNVNSDLDFLRSHGIFYKIYKVIGELTDPGIWPKNIFSLYRQQAIKKGFMPKYDVDGNITE